VAVEPEPRVPVPGSHREPVPDAQFVAAADDSAPVDVDVVLRRAADEPGVGADPVDAARVVEFAAEYGCAVSRVDLAARTVSMAGTVAQMDEAFGVQLGVYQVGDVTYRGRVGEVFIPADLAGVVRAVRGLDDRAQAQPHAIVAHAATVSYAPQEVGRRYGFPAAGTAAFGFVRSSAG
jgi:kumamolisin